LRCALRCALAARYALRTARCALVARSLRARSALSVARCALRAASCALCVVRCALCAARCALCARCALTAHSLRASCVLGARWLRAGCVPCCAACCAGLLRCALRCALAARDALHAARSLRARCALSVARLSLRAARFRFHFLLAHYFSRKLADILQHCSCYS